jgi:hypothetical protein
MTAAKNEVAKKSDDEKTTGKSATFGIVLDIYNTEVPISTNDVIGAVENGLEFRLPKDVPLGRISELEKWFKEKFHVDLPKAENLPAVLKDVVVKLEQLNFKVHQLHLKLPGKSTDFHTPKFTLELSGRWDDGHEVTILDDIFGGGLKIKGLVFGARNE